MTPADALERVYAGGLRAVLVQRRRGRVVHLASLTDVAPARRHRLRPVCGQRAPRWPVAAGTERPVCARCSAWLTRRTPPVLPQPQRAVLEFERLQWRNQDRKENAIRDRFGVNATRYYQRLNALIDDPLAEQFDPVLVHRLRRLRQQHRDRRTLPIAVRSARG